MSVKSKLIECINLLNKDGINSKKMVKDILYESIQDLDKTYSVIEISETLCCPNCFGPLTKANNTVLKIFSLNNSHCKHCGVKLEWSKFKDLQ